MRKIKLFLAFSTIACAMFAYLINPSKVNAAPGDSVVTVQLSDENGNPIMGIAQLNITDATAADIGTFTTNSDGKVDIELPIGTYEIHQTSLTQNASYSMNMEAIPLVVVDNQPMSINLKQNVNKTCFVLYVTELVDTTVGIKGVEVGFYDEAKNLLFTLVSNDTGNFIYDGDYDIRYPIYDSAVKYVKILSAPSNYLLDDYIKDFQMLTNGDRAIDIGNEPMYYYRLVLQKETKPVTTPVITPAVPIKQAETTPVVKTTTKGNKTPATGDKTDTFALGSSFFISGFAVVLIRRIKEQ